MARRVMIWLGVAFLVWFIAFNPLGAATAVKNIAGVVGGIAQGFGRFFVVLVS